MRNRSPGSTQAGPDDAGIRCLRRVVAERPDPFEPVVQERVADLLFGPSGIALGVYRYNIGGGGVGVTHPGHDTETFLVSPGNYDWSRDRGGRRFLQLAAQRRVPI